MNDRTTMTATRPLASLAAVLIAAGAFVGGAPSAARAATSLAQMPPISSEDFKQECKGDENLDPGDVLWHFVLVQTTCPATADLTATFSGASCPTPSVTETSTKCVGGVLHWDVVTSLDCVLTGATTPADGFRLNLSHVCSGEERRDEFFCTLTQGCLGAADSICNCTTAGCNPAFADDQLHRGYLSAAPGDACFPQTAGAGSKSVTIANQCALIVELPTSGTGGALNNSGGALPATFKCNATKSGNNWSVSAVAPGTVQLDRSFSATDKNLGGTGGQGGGILTGHKLTALFGECLTQQGAFAVQAQSLGNLTLPSTSGEQVCATRAGEDKVTGTGDDVCECFAVPDCVLGLTALQVIDCANEHLGTGANSCGCSLSALGTAMGVINRAFDNCGKLVDSCE
jgi:hypothetical protein